LAILAYNTPMKKLFLVFAHPDDESLATGGTIAKYVRSGWHVDLICATKGESGSSGPHAVSGDALGKIREGELGRAAKILGISSVSYLGYKDGMLGRQNPGELEDSIYRAMETKLPDVVITFDTTGISHHPDHIKLCFATTFAFQKYSLYLAATHKTQKVLQKYDEQWIKRIERMVGERIEPRLYYACMPESIARYAIKEKIIPAVSFGKPWIGVKDSRISTIIDIKRFAHLKLRALREHITQMADVSHFLQAEGTPLFDQEYFMLRMKGTQEVFMGKNDSVSDRI